MTTADEKPRVKTDLLVHEIYLSVQGESTWAGVPCTFVRLTGCPLRCTYCDTEYAFTGGQRMTQDADRVPREVHKIVDMKCPSSGEMARNLEANLELLAPHDEVKFVMGTREDYEWSRELVRRYELEGRVAAVLFSCVFGALEPHTLVDWMLADKLFGVRFQLQAHKFIWPPDERGV
jgi:7-carboxy-7-deazaguanine synthase